MPCKEVDWMISENDTWTTLNNTGQYIQSFKEDMHHLSIVSTSYTNKVMVKCCDGTYSEDFQLNLTGKVHLTGTEIKLVSLKKYQYVTFCAFR